MKIILSFIVVTIMGTIPSFGTEMSASEFCGLLTSNDVTKLQASGQIDAQQGLKMLMAAMLFQSRYSTQMAKALDSNPPLTLTTFLKDLGLNDFPEALPGVYYGLAAMRLCSSSKTTANVDGTVRDGNVNVTSKVIFKQNGEQLVPTQYQYLIEDVQKYSLQ